MLNNFIIIIILYVLLLVYKKISTLYLNTINILTIKAYKINYFI